MKRKENYMCNEWRENVENEKKTYICGKCGKKLYYPSHYESHIKKCNGGGFECPLCLNIFPTIHALRLHVRFSHGHIWSRCPICRKEYKSAAVHYSKKKDEEHKMLWVLTTANKGNGRVKEPSSVRRVVNKYLKLFKKKYMCKDGEKR
jgi:hypothetical protein